MEGTGCGAGISVTGLLHEKIVHVNTLMNIKIFMAQNCYSTC